MRNAGPEYPACQGSDSQFKLARAAPQQAQAPTVAVSAHASAGIRKRIDLWRFRGASRYESPYPNLRAQCMDTESF